MSALPKSSDNAKSSSSVANHQGRHQKLLRSKDKQSNESPFFSVNGKKGSFFQPSLAVNRVDDPYEREADKTAEKVTHTIHSGKGEDFFPPNPQAPGASSPDLSRSSFFQRKPAFESPSEMDLNTAANPGIQRSMAQKSSNSEKGGEASPKLGHQLNESKGSGQALSDLTKSRMEPAFGTDFSGTRLHTGDEAVQMNKDLNSQAFTSGNDIYFNQNKYNPETKEGDSLLAHELTHTIQQGAASKNNLVQSKPENANTARKKEQTVAQSDSEGTSQSLTPVDISTAFVPSPAMADYLDEKGRRKYVDVPVKIGKVTDGIIKVKQRKSAKGTEPATYWIKSKQYLPYNRIDFLNTFQVAGMEPVISLNTRNPNNISGTVALKKGNTVYDGKNDLIKQINRNLNRLGLLGLKPISAKLENSVTNGIVTLKASDLKTTVAGYLDAEGGFGLVGDRFVFELDTHVDVNGLAQGDFKIARNEKGQLAGEGEIAVAIANLNGKVRVTYIAGDVTILGTVGIESEKFSGSISIMVADKAIAKQTMMAALEVKSIENEKKKGPSPKAAKKKTKKNQVVIGWGTVTARITPWLEGTAKVGVDDQGQVTIVGTIEVPSEVELMEQKGKKITLFTVEIKAGYGIPLVGQVGLFASIGMFINSGFGPLVLRNVKFEGTYSTDPSVLQNFLITGTLGISAFAIIGLEAKAGVFVTLIGHDIKAGIKVIAAAGIRAYAEATPTFEYAEKTGPAGGKVGEAWLKGHFEAAAQLFLKLAGAFFVELDSPWWSPAPDKTWEYPLGDVEYPLGPSLGIGGDVAWLVGSPEVPELKFSPVDFDPDKFTSDIMGDPPPGKGGGKGGKQKGKGKWEDKSQKKGKEEKPEVKKDNKGLQGKKKEDTSKWPDEKRYMRALGKIGELGDKSKKQAITYKALASKLKRLKQQYRIDQVAAKNKKDGSVDVFVKHAKQNNKRNLIQIKLMSEAERQKLIEATKKELQLKQESKADPKSKTIGESEAKAVAQEVAGKQMVVEDIKVVDGKETWDYQLDLGDKSISLKGLRKTTGKMELSKEDIKIHEKFLEEIKKELAKQPSKKPKTFLKFYSIKKKESLELEKMYQKKLKKGIIISINLSPFEKDKKDNDFDFSIKIQPNTSKTKGQSNFTPQNTKIVNAGTTTFKFKPLDSDSVEGKVAASTKATLIPEDPKIGSSTAGVKTNELLYTTLREFTDTQWVQGHLLNHDLGGKAIEKNLFPITSHANSEHFQEVEKIVKHWIAEGSAVQYDITASKTGGDESAEGKFICKATVLEGKAKYEGKVIHKVINSLTKLKDSFRIYKGKEKKVKKFSEVEHLEENTTYRNSIKKLRKDPKWSHNK